MTEPASGASSQFLSGKHAVVTGGARGIGAAITTILLSHGARVTSMSRGTASPATVPPCSCHTRDFIR